MTGNKRAYLIIMGVTEFVFDEGTLGFTRPCVHMLNDTLKH